MALHSDFPTDLNDVYLYVRKSREDRDAEERARREGRSDEIETLARHRRTLLNLAHKYQHNVTQVLEEVVSGEYISERPAMQRLLEDVDEGHVTGVWVMDLDRLGRGDMADQGAILRAFKDSSTLILTPDKVYDLTDEMDEEWTEFKTFFARRELKMITKRMQRGRIASVMEGKYIGTTPPFGYDVNRDLVLAPNEHADTIRLIFDLYVNKHLGGKRVAEYLNQIGIKSPKGKVWNGDMVMPLLRNEVYAGYIVWRKAKRDKRKGVTHKRPESEHIRAKGQHDPLVDAETWQRSVEIRARRSNAPVPKKNQVSNPLAGIIVCGKCGKKMMRRPYGKQPPHIMCHYPSCNNKSTRLSIVEGKVLEALSIWLREYEVSVEEVAAAMNSKRETSLDHARVLRQIDTEIQQVVRQQDELHDLLERRIYDDATYLDRNQKLHAKLRELREQRGQIEEDRTQSERTAQARLDVIPHVRHVLEVYRTLDSAETKNNLLKTVLEKAVYTKEPWQQVDDFSLTLYPLV